MMTRLMIVLSALAVMAALGCGDDAQTEPVGVTPPEIPTDERTVEAKRTVSALEQEASTPTPTVPLQPAVMPARQGAMGGAGVQSTVAPTAEPTAEPTVAPEPTAVAVMTVTPESGGDGFVVSSAPAPASSDALAASEYEVASDGLSVRMKAAGFINARGFVQGPVYRGKTSIQQSENLWSLDLANWYLTVVTDSASDQEADLFFQQFVGSPFNSYSNRHVRQLGGARDDDGMPAALYFWAGIAASAPARGDSSFLRFPVVRSLTTYLGYDWQWTLRYGGSSHGTLFRSMVAELQQPTVPVGQSKHVVAYFGD